MERLAGPPAGTCLVRRAEPARDNAALCALARRCPQGRRLRFYHERDDFWERCRLQPSADVLVAESAGHLLGSVTVGRKPVWLSRSGWQPTAYVCDLMVAPEARGRGLGRALLRAAREASPAARLFYSHILEDNLASRRLFEGDGFAPHPQPLLYHILLPRLSGRRPPSTFRQLPADAPAGTAIDAVLRTRYDLVDATAGHDGLYLDERRPGRAWGAVRRHDAQVFVGLPWYADLLGRLLPGLPRAGRPLRIWSVHHLGGAGGLVRRLIAAVAWLAAAERIDALAVPVFANDPSAADLPASALSRWGIPPGRTGLYLAGDLRDEVLATTRPLLLSGRDG
jgi:ribosomal protein S18 acetylase RimI-like enzyme